MKNNEKIPLIYLLSMPVILILASLFAHLHISILTSPFYLSVLIYPLLLLVLGLIVKKTSHAKAVTVLSVTLVIQSLVFIMQWVLFDVIDYYLMIYTFISVLFCGLLFIYAYDFLRNIKKDTYIYVFLIVLIISILDNMIFGQLIEGNIISLSILVRVLYAVLIPVFLSKNTAKK